MLTLMDENALLQNLKMIRDKFFNLFLIFFLFASLISIILIIIVYLYLAFILKGSTIINKTQPKSPV
jgi:flagellar biogenesis protein FliO